MQAVMHIKPLYFYTKKMVQAREVAIRSHRIYKNRPIMSRFLISSSRQGKFEGQMKGYGFNTPGKFICLNPLGPIKFTQP